MATEVLTTSGGEQTGAALSAIYGRVAASVESSGGMRIERDPAGAATLDRITYDVPGVFEVEPAGLITIMRVRSGGVRLSRGSARVQVGAGRLYVTEHLDRPYRAVAEQLDEDVTTLPRTLLDDVASTVRGPEADPVLLSGQDPVSSAAAAHFNQIRAQVLDAVRSTPPGIGADGRRLLHGSLGRLLASAALTTFPNTAVVEPTGSDRCDAHPATLRRAVAFVEANPDLDLSVADIAAAARVTPRAVQLAYRRHLGTTPMRHLRRVRLDRAHAELRAASPGDTTVTAVAARWGWTRPSRFAADHLAAYGVYPHAILRGGGG